MKAKVDPYKIEMKAVVTEEVQEYIDASVWFKQPNFELKKIFFLNFNINSTWTEYLP
jgi:hypothetical protein